MIPLPWLGLSPVRWLAVAIVALAPASAAGAQDVQQAFDEGMRAFRDGDYPAAISRFREVVRLAPGSTEAMQLLLESQDQQALVELLMAGGEFETFAREVLEAARTAAREAVRDADAAAADAAGVFTDSYAERARAVFALRTKYGPFAVAPVLAHLASSRSGEREQAIYALSRLGTEATLPLLAATRSALRDVREGVLFALGALADPRAEARIAEMAALDPDPTVRALAAKLSSGDPASLAYAQGWAFYVRDPERGLSEVENHGVMWTVDGARLGWTELPAALVPLELARESLRRAVDLGHPAGAEALALACGSEVGVLEALIREGEEDLAERREECAREALLLGQTALNGALERALERGDIPSAGALVALLDGPGLATDSGLRLAVAGTVPSLRFASALALARAGDSSPETVGALADALGLQALRVVVVADPDRARRAALAGDLAAGGVVVLEASDGASGLLMLQRSVNADAIVVADPLPDLYARRFVVEARRDPRRAETPVFVLGGAETGEIEGAEVVETLSADIVAGAFGELDGQRRLHLETAAAAASSLAELARHRPDAVMPVTPALAGAAGREDEVSIPALHALSHCGTSAEMPALLGVVGDRGRSPAARAAAAGAVAGVLSREPAAPVDPTVLEEAAKEGEPELARACARALALARGQIGSSAG